MKKKSRFLAAGLALVLMFTGCSGSGTPEPEKEPGQKAPAQSSIDEGMKTYGAVVSVEDIKKAYDYDDSKEIMPLYNVEPTEEFEFCFQFDAYETHIDLYDYVSIHTDADCGEESAIWYTADLEAGNGATVLTVSPMTPVLATDSMEEEFIYEDVDMWGNAPIYYIALHYDLEADTPVKLESPVIIPFTVKHEITAPTLRSVVSSDGRFSLEWDAVEGAEKYIVYNFHDETLGTGENDHAVNGAKIGYDCGRNTAPEDQVYLIREGETTECSFDGFSGPESHSTAEITGMTGKKSNSGQNYGVFGDYFVTAVVDGKESGLSNAVSTAGLVLPYKMTEETEIQGRYTSPSDFPSEVEVLNIDGSTTMRKVYYEKSHVIFGELEWDEYDYTVEGTYLYGSVCFDEDEGEPPQSTGASAESGNAVPEDNIDKIPESDVETIIPSDEEKDYKDTPLVDAQAENTKDHIQNGNLKTVENAPEGVYINADTAEEEWLALNLVQGNTEISVEGFPSLQDPYTLVDVFYKVYYQNPYVLGILSFTYDYNTLTLSVHYGYEKSSLTEKQGEIAAKAEEVVKSLITEDMDTQERIDALYNYLVNNSVYDNEALAEAEQNGFKKVEGSAHEDAFNTYGILVEGKGVCMSYAYAFRLLCDLSGVECIVVTGYLNGNLPHAWNMVNIDGKWYEIDCTNNAVNTGIPYFLFQADSGLAETSGYTKDEMFEIDTEVKNYSGDDGSLEYYAQNGLCPETIEEYKQLLTENITESTGVFVVRWQGEIDKEAFNQAVILAYNELGMEEQLETLRYSVTGGFLILINGNGD